MEKHVAGLLIWALERWEAEEHMALVMASTTRAFSQRERRSGPPGVSDSGYCQGRMAEAVAVPVVRLVRGVMVDDGQVVVLTNRG